DQLLKKGRKSRQVTIAVPTFNDVVPALDVAELLHSLRKSLTLGCVASFEPATRTPINAGFVRTWLRATSAGSAAPNPPRSVITSRRLMPAPSPQRMGS